jgi:hypothetical protein
MKITEPLSRKVLTTIDAGLCSGIGSPKPGEMCILAAKRFSMGLSHGDALEGLPIGAAVRELDIPLNDSNWSSNEARAKGMRRLAIAEFGSDEIDQLEFAKRVALRTIQRIVPVALRLAAGTKANAKHAAELLKQALLCEGATDLAAARAAASYAARAASYAARAASYAAGDAARAASYAAGDAASYAARAARAARAAASYAASYAASDAARAARVASRAAGAAASDEVLTMLADIAVEVLTELDCPGCKFLYLCEKAAP